jgi:hypothetical protein
MDELHRALGDISSIRRQMARATEFRGYGPATLAATAVYALFAAGAQSLWVPDPVNHLNSYLAIWISTAAASAALIAVQTITRAHRIHSGLADEMIRMAVEQFLPAVGAGAFLTIVLVWFVPSVLWMLPGLWQIVFSLGIFSSCRFLPRLMLAAGTWYLMTGLICIALAGDRALSPWAMGIPYGVGQLLVAAILYATHEGSDEN